MPRHPVFDVRAEELAHLRTLTPDQAMAVAAFARDGVLDHRQLAALGLDGSAVRRRVSRRALFRRHRGVYAVGRADLTRRGEVRAACCGAGAAPSSAIPPPPGCSTSSVRVGASRSRPPRPAPPGPGSGIELHYTARWLTGEVMWVDGFPCTSVARTLADLAGTSPKDFGSSWDNADQQLLLDVGPLGAQIARGRSGVATLRSRLDHYDERPPTESVLEDVFLGVCRASSIRGPIGQWPLASGDRSGRVDFVWLPERVAVEVDGRRWHAIQAAHDRDRRNDLELRDLGFDPHRYSFRQVKDEGRAPRGSSRPRWWHGAFEVDVAQRP